MDRLKALIQRIAERRSRFTYDLRSDCFVYDGIVAAHRIAAEPGSGDLLADVIQHALANDGIIDAHRDPSDGHIHFNSCRIFTDKGSAFMFAMRNDQEAVFDLGRDERVRIPAGSAVGDRSEV